MAKDEPLVDTIPPVVGGQGELSPHLGSGGSVEFATSSGVAGRGARLLTQHADRIVMSYLIQESEAKVLGLMNGFSAVCFALGSLSLSVPIGLFINALTSNPPS